MTYEQQCTVVDQLFEINFGTIILGRQPSLHERCTVIAFDELFLKPRKR